MMVQEKTIIITGATAGIGQAALEALAAQGAYVIGVGRSAERAAKVKAAINAEYPLARVDFVLADLSSQAQVIRLAEEISELVDQVDVLVNNAGAVSSWYKATEDGYEYQFAVNHLAPFLLTLELLPLLKKSPDGRVITVSSGSHYRSQINWSDVMLRQHYNCLRAYRQSKLANVMFSAELSHRLKGTSVRVFAADPGLVNTEIGLKGTAGIENLVWSMRRNGGVTPAQGAETVVYLAAQPTVEDALYWKDCQPRHPDPVGTDPEQTVRLWALSERLCGVTLNEAVA